MGVSGALVAGAAAAPGAVRAAEAAAGGPEGQEPDALPPAIRALRPMLEGVVPIGPADRAARLEQARRLMRANGMDALVLEPGTSMRYFTGVQWGLSERPFVAVLPASGDPAWVCPGFEEERARELVGRSAEVRAWQEEESPHRLLAGILRDRGATGRVGIESRTRFFVADGLRQEAPGTQLVNGDPVTVGCRMIKAPAELALMQRASDITMAAFGAVFASLRDGITQNDLAAWTRAALSRLGGSGPSALVALGAYSAFPHGSVQLQRLREGDVVLVDCGCTVDGYASDITRTTVFGRPTARQRRIWDLERRAQDAGFRAAQVGATCESVDAAARQVIVDAGFGPGYRVPGLPHRTGHGIGMDGHESPNFVRGETTRLAPGMCFSDEPTIVIYGEFGIRLEDCLYITEDGPRFFSPQSPAIDRPV